MFFALVFFILALLCFQKKFIVVLQLVLLWGCFFFFNWLFYLCANVFHAKFCNDSIVHVNVHSVSTCLHIGLLVNSLHYGFLIVHLFYGGLHDLILMFVFIMLVLFVFFFMVILLFLMFVLVLLFIFFFMISYISF